MKCTKQSRFKMCDAFDAYLYKFKYRYIGRHMAVTLFAFPPFLRKPKNDKISKRPGARLVAKECSNYFLLTLQDILNPSLSFIFGKMQAIKIYSRFSRFLLFW